METIAEDPTAGGNWKALESSPHSIESVHHHSVAFNQPQIVSVLFQYTLNKVKTQLIMHQNIFIKLNLLHAQVSLPIYCFLTVNSPKIVTKPTCSGNNPPNHVGTLKN